jgi:hypothetical protein
LIETEDGTLIRLMYGSVTPDRATFDDVNTWGAEQCKAYAIRSTDGGKSWSAPIDLDRPSTYVYPRGVLRGQIPGTLDLTEATGVAIGNKVMVVVRPIYSPTMWQCWSNDAGATWTAAARTTFPGYAQSMLRLKSGVILVAHRFPGYSINMSRDNGVNWDEGTVIDQPTWAMGCMIEIEPNVVLCTYMNAASGDVNALAKEPLLAQLFRVTPQGLRPITNAGRRTD